MNASEAVLIAIALKQANTTPAEVAPFLPQALDLVKLAREELGPQVQLNGQELPRYLTIRQVAEMLNLSERTVYQLSRKGRIPLTRPSPGILRVNSKALEEHLRVRTSGPRKPRGIE
jgi:excisionase family DNA binding protein